MPDLNSSIRDAATGPGAEVPEQARAKQADSEALTESDRQFAAERMDEARKRLATWALLLGLLGFALLLVPNPIPWLPGPLATGVAVYALVRMRLQPGRYAGAGRALIGLGLGLVATWVCHPWIGWGYDLVNPQAAVERCAANLRAVGRVLQAYHQHYDAYPPSLQTLIDAGQISPKLCGCARAGKHAPAGPRFAYVAGLSPHDPGHWIWLYDLPSHHHGRFGAVLGLDGRTQVLDSDHFRDRLRRFRDEYAGARGQPPTIVPPP